MAQDLYRVMSTAFCRPIECLGIFDAERTASIHRTAIEIANRAGEEVCVEQLVGKDIWHTADLIGDFGIVSPTQVAA